MRNFYLFLWLLCVQSLFAQFTENDVKFWVGEGPEKAFLVVDFKDGTDDASYAWGYRFDPADGKKMYNIFLEIASQEPHFSSEASSNNSFLEAVGFNAHFQENFPDWWSIWGGTSSNTMSMNSGIGSAVQPNMWYGVSYGFQPATAPATPIAAYSSQWFKEENISGWYGSGNNKSIVIIDFGTDTDEVAQSFAFGVRFNNVTLSYAEILTLLSTELSSLDIVQTDSKVSAVTFTTHTGTANENASWKIYKGNNLSDWVTQPNLTGTLENNEWLGLSFGKRRPFIPQDGYSLGTPSHRLATFSVYPNPTNDNIHIQTQETLIKASLYNLMGSKIIETKNTSFSMAHLAKGIYLLEVETQQGKATQKIIKK